MDQTSREPGSLFPGRLVRTRLYEQVAEQITSWIAENGLQPGDRLPPERELATRLGVSRATLSQALVALEVIGVVAVRHGDGTVVTQSRTRRIVEAIREHADRLPEIIDTRDALETKIAALGRSPSYGGGPAPHRRGAGRDGGRHRRRRPRRGG